MADGKQKDWRELCLAVTNESDSIKLSSLIQQLIEALDKRERSLRHTEIVDEEVMDEVKDPVPNKCSDY